MAGTARLPFNTLLVLAIGAVLLHFVSGCGFTTHNLIAQRARQWFQDLNNVDMVDIINDNIPSLQGGAPYPDYLYTCGSDHDAGEDTHWPPFQAAAAAYIKDKFPQPWSDHAKKLVVFMLGVTSHYIADINWHGLRQVPYGQGFIRTMGSQNYNCSGELCSTAHTEADTGGEFVASFEYNLSFYRPEHWYVPVKDLVEIYKYRPEYVNKTVNASAIEECSLLFQTGSIAIKDFGPIIFPDIVAQAPFLPEEYSDFYLGGVDDMAVWSSFMWNRMVSWAIYGPPNGTLPNSEAMNQARTLPCGDNASGSTAATCSVLQRQAHVRLLRRLRPIVAEAARRQLGDADGWYSLERDSHGGITSRVHRDRVPLALREKLLREVLAFLADELHIVTDTSRVESVIKHVLTSSELAQQEDSSAATAPQPHKGSATLQGEDGGVWQSGHHANQYFGASLCRGDLDGDGTDDVVVGSPGYGSPEAPQQGRIDVHLSSSQFVHNSSLIGPLDYARFGAACDIVDMNLDGKLDIVVGAPAVEGKDLKQVVGNYTGRVFVFYQGSGLDFSRSFDGADDTPAAPSIPDVTMFTNRQFASLGGVISSSQLDCANTTALVLGVPFYGTQDNYYIHHGAVFIVKASSSLPAQMNVETDSQMQLKGSKAFMWFGQSAKAACINSNGDDEGEDVKAGTRPILAVGSPGFANEHGTVGQVALYELNQALTNASLLANWTYGEDRSKFGYSISLSPADDLLVVSSPSFGKRLVDVVDADRVSHGRVYVYSLAKAVATGTTVPPSVHLDGKRDFARLGTAMRLFKASNGCRLVVSSPLMEHESGQVYVFDVTSPSNQPKLSKTFTYSAHSARCGTALALVDSSLYVACPKADVEASKEDAVERAGAVIIEAL